MSDASKSWVKYFGDGAYRIVLVHMAGDRKVTFLNLHWINPLNGNMCLFIFAWPRRDNYWARWRYTSFTRTNECRHFLFAAQKVFW